jgi:hypothetical protein
LNLGFGMVLMIFGIGVDGFGIDWICFSFRLAFEILRQHLF